MKLHKLCCPNCNGTLDIKIDNKDCIFCPFCGEKFFVDDGKKEYTINQNINIKKQVSHIQRIVDDADIIRAKTEDREQKNAWRIILYWVALIFFLIAICTYMEGADDRAAKRAAKEGKISAGSYEEYKGEHYQAVVEQLEVLGFENISCVDLDDSGVLFWRAEEVESVSIGGDTDFSSNDYFDSDEKVIVKYH